jgi:hypothetical protein
MDKDIPCKMTKGTTCNGWPCTIKGHPCVSAKSLKIHLRIREARLWLGIVVLEISFHLISSTDEHGS